MVKRISEKCICILFALYAVYILIAVLFRDLFFSNVRYCVQKVFLLNNVVMILSSVVIIIFLYFINKKIKLAEHSNKLIIAATGLLFLLELYIAYNIYFIKIGWDISAMTRGALEMLEMNQPSEASNNYISQYPNNMFLQYIFYWVLKVEKYIGVLDVSNHIFGLIFVQCIIFSITEYILFRVIWEESKSVKTAWFGYIIYLCLLGLSSWYIVPYSDGLGLFFTISIVRLLQLLKNDKYKYLKLILITVLSYWGFRLKPQIGIGVIAFSVVYIIQFIDLNNKLSFLKNNAKYILIILITLGVSLYGNRCLTYENTYFTIDNNKTKAVTHMIMMGLNSETDGVWSLEDNVFSNACKTQEERKKANLQESVRRIKEYGVIGLAKHQYKKTLVTYNDGTFAWGVEGGFYGKVIKDKNSFVSPKLKHFYYSGPSHEKLATFQQFSWIFLLICMGLFIFKKNKNTIELVCMLTLFGLFAFEMIFEARARYLITNVPIFIVIGSLGLQNTMNYLRYLAKSKFGK